MQLTKRQLEFWAFVIILCLSVSIMVMVIDFGIKAAILEESIRLRVKIDQWEVANGRRPASTNDSRVDNDDSVDDDLSYDVLVVDASRMETGHDSNGSKTSPNSTRAGRRSQSNGADTDSSIQTGNE